MAVMLLVNDGRLQFDDAHGLAHQTRSPPVEAVDLDAPVRGWEQYDCVRKHLSR